MRFDPNRIDRRRLVPALILIGLGLLGLLGGFGGLLGRLLGTALFAAAAFAAFTQAQRTRALYWRIAAYTLAGLAAATLLEGPVGGAAFLASLAIPFAFVWRDDERRWWALIPAGALASLAATTLLDASGMLGGAVFLLGLAGTFFALTRLRVRPQPWGIYPAVVLGLLGVLTLSGSAGWWLPLLMVAVGLYLLLRPARTPPSGEPPSAAAESGAIAPATVAPIASTAAPLDTSDSAAPSEPGDAPPPTDPDRGS